MAKSEEYEELQHVMRTEAYARAVKALMEKTADDIVRMKEVGKFDPDKEFKWEDYPSAYKEMEKLTTRMATQMVAIIGSASKDEWLAATRKNDRFIESIMDTSKLPKRMLEEFQDRNLEALKTFQGRKVNGMDLSQRVWKYTNQFKQNIEDAIDFGLGNGTSADELSRDVRSYLQDPDRFYRRFRIKVGEDENGKTIYGRKWKRMVVTPEGNVKWIDESPESYHSGRGIYRSSYKNAMRLTRSEINMAYRESEWQRWQHLDFVVGFEVHRANVSEDEQCDCDICESLKGKYPKNFKFVGWHPQCKCYITPILIPEDELDKNNLAELRAAVNGKEYKKQEASNQVIHVPDEFKEFTKNMALKILNGKMIMKSTPYFIRDNFVGGNLFKGLNPKIESATPILTPLQAKAVVDEVVKKAKKTQRKKAVSFADKLEALKPEIAKLTKEYETWRFDYDSTIKIINDGIDAQDIKLIEKGMKEAQKQVDKWHKWDDAIYKQMNNSLQYARESKYRDLDVEVLEDTIFRWHNIKSDAKMMYATSYNNTISRNIIINSRTSKKAIDFMIKKELDYIDKLETFEELEEYMNVRYLNQMDSLIKLDIEEVKALCKTYAQSSIKWGMDKIDLNFRRISRDALMWANGKHIEVNTIHFGKKKTQASFESNTKNYKDTINERIESFTKTIENLQKRITDAEKQLNDGSIDNLSYTIRVNEAKSNIRIYQKYLNRYQKLKDLGCEYFTLHYAKDKNSYIAETIQHEIGHVVHDQLIGGSNKILQSARYAKKFGFAFRQQCQLRNDWISLYKKYKDTIPTWLSEYGATNEYEMMAECMVNYMSGRTQKFPKDVLDFFDYLYEKSIG